MSFENLQLFRDIAQFGSLTRAAEQNGITASAASQQMNELERLLGVSLLDRSKRPLSLTVEGLLYQELCRDVLRRNGEFRVALDQLKTKVQGSVAVAAIYSVGLSEMSRLESEFVRRHPQAQLMVEYLRPEKVYESVLAEKSDLGLVSYPEPTKEIAVLSWRQEEMVLAAQPEHPLLHKHEIQPQDLDRLDFITFDEDLPIAREIARYLRQHGVDVNTIMRFDNIQMIKEAVMLGSGVSIVPARILQNELLQGRIGAVPLAAPGLHRPLGIIHRKKKRFNRAAQAFLDLLQEAPLD